MKHIFLVHSPITFLVSVSVIRKLRIPKEDALIFFYQFDKITLRNEQYTCISVSKSYNNASVLKKAYNYVRHFNMIDRIDRLVNEIIREKKFIAYVPVVTLTAKSLITHPNCVAFNFIEEGLTQYFKEETLRGLAPINLRYSWRSSIFGNTRRVLYEMYTVLRGYNLNLLALPFTYSCYNSLKDVSFYGLTQESFPLIDNKKKILVPFEKESFELIEYNTSIDLDDQIVWIGDPGVFHYGFSQAIYLEGIKKGCIDFIKSNGKEHVLIKFHRDEPDNLRQEVKKLFKDNGISFEIIPDDVIMELLLFEAKNVALIGVYSSLLFYASIMSHTSFSIYEFLKTEYSAALQNRDFSFYWNKVNLIKLPHASNELP